MKFTIAWPPKCVTWRRRPHDERWLLEATLLERRLVPGCPRLQMICKLAPIDENEAGAAGAEAREKFWADASRRLGRLYRLSDRDLDEIEALLSRRVPRPVPVWPSPQHTATAAACGLIVEQVA